jgi:hypothetical protein
LDRKVLADMAVHDQEGFKKIAALAKKHLPIKPDKQNQTDQSVAVDAGNVHA